MLCRDSDSLVGGLCGPLHWPLGGTEEPARRPWVSGPCLSTPGTGTPKICAVIMTLFFPLLGMSPTKLKEGIRRPGGGPTLTSVPQPGPPGLLPTVPPRLAPSHARVCPTAPLLLSVSRLGSKHRRGGQLPALHPLGRVAWPISLFSKILMTPACFPSDGRHIAFMCTAR